MMDEYQIRLVIVTTVLTALAVAAVILKIWTRFKLIRMTGMEDIITAFSGVRNSKALLYPVL